jgi:hypothetical protein
MPHGQRVWLKCLRREILGTDDLSDHHVSYLPSAIVNTGGRPQLSEDSAAVKKTMLREHTAGSNLPAWPCLSVSLELCAFLELCECEREGGRSGDTDMRARV